ncbi:MAG: ATP-binding cassette domain-containing protein [Dehalococcoidia bacterium]|nr:ATP-binding cassette domain-containing protein [Dehalococcoidia bacterium]
MVLSKTKASTAVVLEGLSKRYGALEALAPLSLSIEQGETVAFLGPSGSGKTTLLLLLSGQMAPDTGRLSLKGKDMARMRPGREQARLVGMIHQQFDLVPQLSALHNVLAGRLGAWSLPTSMLSLVWPRDRDMAMAALARVGVADQANLRAGRLSGGEQQRVAIARLLVQDPAVILADEPVASLDPARAEEVLNLLVDVVQQSNKTLIASMHAVELAREHFSRLIGLRNGVVQFDLPSHQVTDGMLHALYDLQGLRDES